MRGWREKCLESGLTEDDAGSERSLMYSSCYLRLAVRILFCSFQYTIQAILWPVALPPREMQKDTVAKGLSESLVKMFYRQRRVHQIIHAIFKGDGRPVITICLCFHPERHARIIHVMCPASIEALSQRLKEMYPSNRPSDSPFVFKERK